MRTVSPTLILETQVSDSQQEMLSTNNIIVLGGLLLLAVFIGEVLIGPQHDGGSMAKTMDTMDDVAMRIKPVVTLDEVRSNASSSAGAGSGAAKTPAEMYQAACFACHGTGAAGAPKLGDTAAWSERIGKGIDALTSAAISGVGAMPPRGGSQFDDDQLRAVVEYLVGESQ